MTQPLSLRLPEGIRFFPHPLPAVPSATSLRRAYLVFLLTKLDLNSRCVFCKPLPHLVVRPRPLHGAGITMIADRHGFWGGRRLRRFPQGAEVSVSKSEPLVAEQVERADFSSAGICSAKPPAVPEAVKRHRKPPEGRVLQGFHEPPPKSVTVSDFESLLLKLLHL